MLGSPLSEEQAVDVYSVLDDAEALSNYGEFEKRAIETAIAAVLLVGASDWAAGEPDVEERLGLLLERSVPAFTVETDPIDDRLDLGPALVWAAIGAIHSRALERGDVDRWNRILGYGLATGDARIVGTITAAARELRSALGPVYHSIVEAGVFGAALNALRRRFEGEPVPVAAVARWRRRLATRPLRMSKSPPVMDLVALSSRIERLWHSRFRRLSDAPRSAQGRKMLRRRYSFGVSSDLLFAIFAWALEEDLVPPADQLPEHRQVIRMLWDLVAWQLRDDPFEPIDDNEGYGLIDRYGQTLLQTISARTPLGTAAESRILWEPVLSLGPRGEYTLEHMIGGFFLRLYKNPDPAHFISNWDAMVALVFAPGWADKGKWWKGRSILRRMLGIDAAHQIATSPEVMAHVQVLKPYYETFAANHIAHDDSVLSAFASFFAATAGASLRLEAICWIEAALTKDDSTLRGNAGSALADLARVMLAEHSAELVANRASREALINVIGRMVRDQAPYALALQDRARALR